MAQQGEGMDDMDVHIPAADNCVGGGGGAGNGVNNGLGGRYVFINGENVALL